jgi:hypothetical protein
LKLTSNEESYIKRYIYCRIRAVIVHELCEVNIGNNFVSVENLDDYVDVCWVWKNVWEKIIGGIETA